MLETLSRHSASARWMYDNPHIRRPKLSTLAKGEVQEVERYLQRAEGVLDRLSPETEIEIRASFWRNRLFGRARAGQARRFWQTWQMADDHFLSLQAACERMEGRQGHLSAQMRRELEAVVAVFDRLRAKIEGLTTVSRDVLEQAFSRSTANAVDPATEDSLGEDPLTHARSWLQTLGSVLGRTRIQVRKGRDEAPEPHRAVHVSARFEGCGPLHVILWHEPGSVWPAGDDVGAAQRFRGGRLKGRPIRALRLEPE